MDWYMEVWLLGPASFSLKALNGVPAVPLLLLLAVLDDPPKAKPEPVFDAPKPWVVFAFVFVFELNGLLAVF